MSRKKAKPHKPYAIARSGGQSAEILLYEQIGNDFWEEGITAKQFASDLRAIGKVRTIDVRINSPGGSAFDGLAIYNALKEHPANVTIHIDGLAASIASVIAMVGDEVRISETALMMLHNPSGMAAGNANDIRAYLTMLEKIRESIVLAYQEKTGLSADEIEDLLDKETWLTADEAVASGFADAISNQPAIAAKFERPDLAVPEALQDQFSNLFNSQEEPQMSTSTPASQEPQAATVEELSALPGSDAQFVVDQLMVKATLTDAQAALSARVLDQLNAAVDEIDKLKAENSQLKQNTAAPPVSPPTEPKSVAQQTPAEGAEPVLSSKAPEEPNSDPMWGGDPLVFHRNLVRAKVAEGMSSREAAIAIENAHPELIQAIQDTVTPD